MSNNDKIQAVFADLELQKVFNYCRIAKKYEIDCITLIRRFIGKTVLYSRANIEYQQTLNIVQKKVLLGHI